MFFTQYPYVFYSVMPKSQSPLLFYEENRKCSSKRENRGKHSRDKPTAKLAAAYVSASLTKIEFLPNMYVEPSIVINAVLFSLAYIEFISDGRDIGMRFGSKEY